MRAAANLAGLVAVALVVAACGAKNPDSAPATDAAQQAKSATGKVAVLIRDVQPAEFDKGAPTQCSVLYDVYNNSDKHLYKAHAAFGEYTIDLADETANTPKTDLTATVEPVTNSCVGVVENMIQSIGHLTVTDCSMENVSEGECQEKVVAFFAPDRSAETKIRQAEQAQAQEYAAQQAKDFEQAKAQEWAQRGQFEAAVSTSFWPTPSVPVVSVDAVLAPDFDPTKIDSDTPIATSSVALCQTGAAQGDPASHGRLVIAAVDRDQFGLASWYKIKMACDDGSSQMIWVKSASFNALRQSDQLVVQAAPH